jgi:hypothetical protein
MCPNTGQVRGDEGAQHIDGVAPMMSIRLETTSI